jgi:hypothetical protein
VQIGVAVNKMDVHGQCQKLWGRWGKLIIFAYVSTLAFWFVAQTGYITQQALQKRLAVFQTDGVIYYGEFVHYFSLSQVVYRDNKTKLYDQSPENVRKIGIPSRIGIMDISPLTYFLMLPLAPLEVDYAQLVWSFVTFILGMIACCVIAKNCSCASNLRVAIIAIGIASSAPSIITMYLGQVSWFLTAAMGLYLWAFFKKKDLLAGLFLVFTAVKFQYMPFLLIPLIVERRWKLMFSSVGSGLILLALIGFGCGFQNLISYPAFLLHFEHVDIVCVKLMVCVRGVLERLLPAHLTLPVSCALLLIALFWLYHVWMRAGTDELKVRLAMSCTLCSCLVFAPHCFVVDTLLLGIIAAFFLTVYDQPSVASLRHARVFTLLIIMAPAVGWIFYLLGLFKFPDMLLDLAFDISLLAAAASMFYDAAGRVDGNTTSVASAQ